MSQLLRFLAASALVLGLAGGAHAFGGGSSDSSSDTTTTDESKGDESKGDDSKDDKSNDETKTEYKRAVEEIKRGAYGAAIPILEGIVARDPADADALNQLGFSHRKLGEFPVAFDYYQQALAVDPDHKGANEYLGELYLEMGDLGSAERQLAKLDDLCGVLGCEEKTELDGRIETFKAE
ncbi:MAG: tetratricopeptide repeat protein [Rhodospirillaceae bacterium]|jgi:tetratricopeptide (TPR) repeat protein|nr:tetratricopeptide repeat protein [Rhodospirillaceae bacterium]